MATCAELRAQGGWLEDTLGDQNDCRFPIAPVNTYSNVAYILCGWLGLYWRDTGPGLVFAILMTLLGIASGLYHGFKTLPFNELDECGMYAILSGLVTYALAPTHRDIAWIMLAVAGLVVGFVGYGPQWSVWLDPLTGAFVSVLTLSLLLHGAWLPLLTGLAVFGAAYKVWHMDKDRTFWWPRWGHGVWHVGTSIGLLIFFLGLG